MDGFPRSVPPEVIRLILLEAVKARGLTRAVRLRLVSRSWNREVTEAIVDSDMLDCHSSSPSPFWPKRLMRMLRQSESRLSRPLRILRRVAQHIVAFRTREADADAHHDLVDEYLWDICQLNRRCIRSFHWFGLLFQFTPLEQIGPIHDSDQDFKEALLAAAAATNDLAFVQDLLPSFRDCPYLIFQNGEFEYEPLLDYPLELAAFQGHVEMLRTLLGTIDDPTQLKYARLDGVLAASRSNQICTLEHCLDPAYDGHNDALIDALKETTSVEVFDRIFPRCKDLLIDSDRSRWMPPRSETDNLRLQSRLLSNKFHDAARDGNLTMMEYLVQLGVSPRCIDHQDNIGGRTTIAFRNHVSAAAARGCTEVVVYLLENGAQIGSRSLEAASMSGNVGCVRALLKYIPHDDLGSSLLRAVEREHDEVLRLLLRAFTPPYEVRKQALDVARSEGLLSMARVLEEYSPVRRS